MNSNKESALYIHVPFCIKKCAYCDFASYEDYDMQEAYFDALIKEARAIQDKWVDNKFDTLFIGGGTPSSVKNEYIERIIEEVSKLFDIKLLEATIEANPGTVNFHKLQFYSYMGLNRISFGMQSTHDEILKEAGRVHTFSEAKESIELAKKAGFSNISVDLMSGLPLQTKEHLLESVNEAAKMGVNHISMYTLKLEEGTHLFHAVNNGDVVLPDKDSEHEMSKAARKELYRLGYARYEISNYAKNGYESLHNLHYWRNDDYLGLGLAASSAKSGLRTTNTRDINEYISKKNSGRDSYIENAQSGKEEYAFETLMLGLRLTEGVSFAEYQVRHGIDLGQRFKAEIESLIERNLAQIDNGRLYLTDEGMDVQNSVLVDFMEKFEF
jgi:oxygen-independent coproporphyrinogen-3 oxidase